MRTIRSARSIVARLFIAVTVIAAALAVAPEVRAQGFGGTVDDLLVRGDSLLAQKRPNEAIVQYQEVRTLCPSPAKTVSSFIGEAKGRMELGEALPAAGLLEEAAATYPDDPRVAEMLLMAGFARQKKGQLADAASLYRRALENSPTRDILPTIKIRLARVLRLSGSAGEVIELLEDFEASFPGSPQIPTALYFLAIAQHDFGDLEASEATYREVIGRFPGSRPALEGNFELAEVLREQGRKDEAIAFYREFVTLQPRSPYAARALEHAGDLLLLRSPSESVRLYELAAVKADANPRPTTPALAISSWLGMKRALAGALSRGWFIGLLLLVLVLVAGGGALLTVQFLRRRRATGAAGT